MNVAFISWVISFYKLSKTCATNWLMVMVIHGMFIRCHLDSMTSNSDFFFNLQGTVRDDFRLEGGMDIGMKEAEEGVEMETMEVAGAMVGVTLMAGLSLEAGVATEKDFQTAEVMDISGLIMQVAMVAVQIVLVD